MEALPEITDRPSFFDKEQTWENARALFSDLRLYKFKMALKHWLSAPGVALRKTGVFKLYNPAVQGAAVFPECSDGVALLDLEDEPNPVLTTYMTADSDGAGVITSTPIIAAGGAGVKWIILEVEINAAVIASPGAPCGAVSLAISDISSWSAVIVGGNRTRLLGPVKQDTAATAINLSAGAGGAQASSRFSFTVRYRAGS